MRIFRSAMCLALILVSVLASSVFAAQPMPAAREGIASAEPATTRDAQWDDRFGMSFSQRFAISIHGDSGEVNAAAVFNGELYVGGRFYDTGKVTYWHDDRSISAIARWNGREWRNVGPSDIGAWTASATIEALLVHDGSLYAAGVFSNAGGVPAANIARWDGAGWHALGSGLTIDPQSSVYQRFMSLAVWNDEIYVLGPFSAAGGVAVNNIARWDGAGWHAVGAGLSRTSGPLSYQTALVGTPQGLYAGGYFDRSGDKPMPLLARWDGVQWSAPIPELSGIIRSMVWHDNQLYVAGAMSVGYGSGFGVLRWDGANREILGSGFSQGTYGFTIRSVGGDLYVSANQEIFRWTGTAWASLGVFFTANDRVSDMISYNDRFVALGLMTWADDPRFGDASRYVLEWNGSKWRTLGAGLSTTFFDPASVSLLASVDNALYASAGTIIHANGQAIRNLARWNGTRWDDVSYEAADGRRITALTGGGSALYAGSYRYEAGGATSTHSVARLDGAGWTTLSSQFNGPITALAWSDGVLYAGGSFTAVGALPVRGLARWDGAQWSDVYGGALYNVTELVVRDGVVYAAGTQDAAAGAPNRIVRGTAAGWSTLADVGAKTLALDSAGSLYAGGEFSAIGGVAAARIARWRNGAWEALGDGIGGTSVDALSVGPDGAVYAGGKFTMAGGIYTRNIARYNGQWNALGRGVDAPVLSLAADAAGVYVGGTFLNAGATVSSSIARWPALPVINAAPQAVADTATTVRGQNATIAVLANDADANEDALTITGVTTPTHGSVAVVGKTVRYTPANDFVGAATFSYAITDGFGGTASGSVTVTISNRNPQPGYDVVSTERGQSVDIAVLANDSDPDQDVLTVTGVAAPVHGTAQVVNGVVRYTPAGDFVGTEILNYTVSDGYGGTASAAIGVNIIPRMSLVYVPLIVR